MSTNGFRFPTNGVKKVIQEVKISPIAQFYKSIAQSQSRAARERGNSVRKMEWETTLERAHRLADSGKNSDAAEQYHRAAAMIKRRYLSSGSFTSDTKQMAEVAFAALGLSFTHYFEGKQYASSFKAAEAAFAISVQFPKHSEDAKLMLQVFMGQSGVTNGLLSRAKALALSANSSK